MTRMRAMAVGGVLLAFTAAAGAGAKKLVGPKEHVEISANELKWTDGPPTLPPGIKMAVLSGDPKAEGPFVMRLKAQAGYRIPPHWHPAHEHVTVISGVFHLGMGDKVDDKKLRAFKAGDFAMMPPKHTHFASVSEETVIQVHGWGPWAITYVNPGDDPRGKAAR